MADQKIPRAWVKQVSTCQDGRRIRAFPSFRLQGIFFVGRAAMQRGTIKKLVADKGFGFITAGERGKDLFFHVSALQETAFESLFEGQDVEFEQEVGPKGPRASVVRPAS
jgi:CspA family cold shock protein